MLKSSLARAEVFLVKWQVFKLIRLTTSCNNNVFGLNFLSAANLHIDGDAMGARKSAPSNHVVHAKLFEVLFNVVGASADGLLLRLLHLVEISLDVSSLNAHATQLFLCDGELTRVVEQSLRGNATFIHANATDVLFVIDADGLEAFLRGTDGRSVAAGAAADDSDVILLLDGEGSLRVVQEEVGGRFVFQK